MAKGMKSGVCYYFGENIDNLTDGRLMLYNKVSLKNFLSNKVKVELNMLSSGMLDRICLEKNRAQVNTPDNRWLG